VGGFRYLRGVITNLVDTFGSQLDARIREADSEADGKGVGGGDGDNDDDTASGNAQAIMCEG